METRPVPSCRSYPERDRSRCSAGSLCETEKHRDHRDFGVAVSASRIHRQRLQETPLQTTLRVTVAAECPAVSAHRSFRETLLRTMVRYRDGAAALAVAASASSARRPLNF